jgi:hypothetical protein
MGTWSWHWQKDPTERLGVSWAALFAWRIGGYGGVRIDRTASIRVDVSSSRHADRKRDRQAEGSANGGAAGVARTTGSARPVRRGASECGRTVQGERR